jgi:hypothetical protein
VFPKATHYSIASPVPSSPGMHTVWTVLALISALGTVPAQTLSDSQVQQVKSNLASVAKQRYVRALSLVTSLMWIFTAGR